GNTKYAASAPSQNAPSAMRTLAVVISSPPPRTDQPRRPQYQDQDHHCVDQETADLRKVILAADVGHADQQCRIERSGDGAGAADRYHDQKIDQIFERKRRIEPEHVDTKRTAQPSQAAAERESGGKHPIDVNAKRARDALVFHRSTYVGTKARAGE